MPSLPASQPAEEGGGTQLDKSTVESNHGCARQAGGGTSGGGDPAAAVVADSTLVASVDQLDRRTRTLMRDYKSRCLST